MIAHTHNNLRMNAGASSYKCCLVRRLRESRTIQLRDFSLQCKQDIVGQFQGCTVANPSTREQPTSKKQ